MGPLISLSLLYLSQLDMISQMTHTLPCLAIPFTGGSLKNEQLDEFPNVLTNSSGAIIGGSCTGGLVLFLVVLFFLYRLYKFDNSIDDDSYCARCGRTRDSRCHGDGGINAANVLEVCTCILSSG